MRYLREFVPTVELGVEGKNDSALALYRSVGFHEYKGWANIVKSKQAYSFSYPLSLAQLLLPVLGQFCLLLFVFLVVLPLKARPIPCAVTTRGIVAASRRRRR